MWQSTLYQERLGERLKKNHSDPKVVSGRMPQGGKVATTPWGPPGGCSQGPRLTQQLWGPQGPVSLDRRHLPAPCPKPVTPVCLPVEFHNSGGTVTTRDGQPVMGQSSEGKGTFFFLFEREIEGTRGGGRQRQREKHSLCCVIPSPRA